MKQKYIFVDDFVKNHTSLQVSYQIGKSGGLEKYLEKQYDVVDKLINKGFTLEQIELALQFVIYDKFWCNQILSVSKLLKTNKDGIPYIVVMLDQAKNILKTKQFKTIKTLN